MNRARTFAVVSVPHTGHIFTVETLRGERREDRVHHGGPAPAGFTFMQAHVYADMMPTIRWWARHWPVVSPQRHPLKVAETYLGRGEKIVDMLDCWRRLIALARDFPIHFLPVDSAGRERALLEIGGVLGERLTTDWTPQNSRGIHTEVVGSDRVLVADFMDEHCEFFARFGYEPPAR